MEIMENYLWIICDALGAKMFQMVIHVNNHKQVIALDNKGQEIIWVMSWD